MNLLGGGWEAGIVLTGTEVKSPPRAAGRRWRRPSPNIRDGEAWLNGLEISIYDQGRAGANHEPVRTRAKLLLPPAGRSTPSTARSAKK